MNAGNKLRTYGAPPFHIVVLHGGPGALGEMQPVAAAIARRKGVLEPLLSSHSIDGQLAELYDLVQTHGTPPFILCGHSWGAWLAFLFTARHPDLVRQLILISSGPFKDHYAAAVAQTRLRRLSQENTQRLSQLQTALDRTNDVERNVIFATIGEILFQVDSYQPDSTERPAVDCRYDVFFAVWTEAEHLRKTGSLLRQGRKIRCPVLAIHGEYDPHPAEGVQQPLSKVLRDFRFVLLPRCGHYPWLEREAKDSFYQTLFNELGE